MSWMDEIPENNTVQVRVDGNFGMVYDTATGASEFTQGVVNTSGDTIVSAVNSRGEAIVVTKTENDDGSANYSYGREPGEEITLKFIFPDETADKNLNFYPPEKKRTGLFRETFSDNSFDNPWSVPSGSEDLLTVSALIDDMLVASFYFGRYEGAEGGSYRRELDIYGAEYGNLWVSLNADVLSGFEREDDGETTIWWTDFWLELVCEGGKGSISLNLSKSAKVLSGDIENPVDWISGDLLNKVIIEDGILSVKIWPDIWGNGLVMDQSIDWGNNPIVETDKPIKAILHINAFADFPFGPPGGGGEI